MGQNNNQNSFKVVSSPLSAPFYPKNSSANKVVLLSFGIIFVFIGICSVITPAAQAIGIFFIILGAIGIFWSVMIFLNGTFQTGNCPYCERKLIMKTKEKRFPCPLCNKPIIKTKTTIENSEPLPVSETSEPKITIETNELNIQATVSTLFTTVVSDSDKYYQRWDENYDKELGYEWFKICTEYINFPEYNTVAQRLVNIRKAQGTTQLNIAKCLGISNKTLSAYENGYSIPTAAIFEALANCYKVPVRFIKQGIGNDLISHAKLCLHYGEKQYIESLSLSIRAASRMFRDLLTFEDIELCTKLDDEFNFGIGFAEILDKESIKREITDNLIGILSSGDINQTEFYSSLAENRQVGINVVKELSEKGTISKIPHGKSFILHLNDMNNK